MSDVKHTPGPWAYDPNTATVDVAGTDIMVAGINDHDRIGWEEGEANARLIAAAPEMLALLKNLHADLAGYAKRTEEVWSSGSIAFGSLADMCALIVARVEGREPKLPGCQHCGEPHGVSVPCGFRRVEQ